MKRQPGTNIALTRPPAEPASSSWWLGLAPTEFKRQLQQELPRMQGSKFAAHTKLITDTGGARS